MYGTRPGASEYSRTAASGMFRTHRTQALIRGVCVLNNLLIRGSLRLDLTTKNPRSSGTVFCTRATGKNFIFFLNLSSDLSRWVLPLSVYVLPLGAS
jgi:ribosome biogenesis protein Nip4